MAVNATAAVGRYTDIVNKVALIFGQDKAGDAVGNFSRDIARQ